MLSHLWSWGSSNPTSRASSILDDEDEDSVSQIDDDLAADKLLAQFPAYGTNEANPDWSFADNKDLDVLEDDVPPAAVLGSQETQGDHSAAAADRTAAGTSSTKQVPATSLLPAWDPREESLWNATTSEAVTSPATSSATPILPETDEHPKEHWMPDQLCKQCHLCETPFTVFRRRHHCRLCGQVFCSSCSAFFVKGERVCRDCNAMQERTGEEMGNTSNHNTKSSTNNSNCPNSSTPTAHPQHVPQPLLEPMMPQRDPKPRNAKETAQLATTTPLTKQQTNDNLGATAATHLQKLCLALLETDAPLLYSTLSTDEEKNAWANQLLTLVTRACFTVDPSVKTGDSLDVRPYVKIKTIPGGNECAYLSGVMFHKGVVHKRMARSLSNPRILLLSGGMEFPTSVHNSREVRMASLDILLEQEDKYTEILVLKILRLQPDLVLVGKSVSRKALEILLQKDVVVLQHVKPHLMQRIARQTGATIVSPTQHVMNQFNTSVLGYCKRFRLVSVRDNTVWMDDAEGEGKSIPVLLQEASLSHPERQAALAAQKLGTEVMDGSVAIKTGLAKRSVAQTYVLLEGCPPHLGCTVVLRGDTTVALKQVKRVVRFLVMVAYHLRLEMSYLKERCAQIPRSFQEGQCHVYSSSICVDFGMSRLKVRPWNGTSGIETSISGEITAFDHQSILITSVWMTDKTQCCPAEVKGIVFYSLQDVSLGQFLRDSCFNLSLKCQNPNCKKSVLDHTLSFIHNDGLINITVEHMDDPLPPAPQEESKRRSSSKRDTRSTNPSTEESESELDDSPIATWTYCMRCKRVVTPLVYISEDTWKLSFGKFLEIFFYNRDAVLHSDHGCCCPLQTSAVLYFGCGRLAARFTYERIKPFGVYVCRNLPLDESYHCDEAVRQLEQISVASSELFVKFDKHIEQVSREARSLFGSAANRPEHLQTVLSELNMVGSEVDHAAKTLQEKIASVSDKCQANGDGLVQEALFRFPWYSRRYLFMLTTAWNERLSAAGQALAAMRKLADSRSVARADIIGPDGSTDDLMEGMRRLRMLNEMYSQYNVTDITTMLPTLPGNNNTVEMDDDEFEDGEGTVSTDFADGVDADVVASRKRLHQARQQEILSSNTSETSGRLVVSKALGTARSADSFTIDSKGRPLDVGSSAASLASKNKAVTPGGAVKSALTRFFNRGGKEFDPYQVDLGIFKEGRPRLEPGVDGVVVPVLDEIPSTVIAYSLSSSEYQRQMAYFSRLESRLPPDDKPPHVGDPTKPSGETAGGPDSSVDAQKEGHAQSGNMSNVASLTTFDERKSIERRMLQRDKSHIKHTFRDFDAKGQQTCKFVCTTYWATQFQALRQAFLAPKDSASSMDVEKGYIQSLSSAYSWAASGGKSGASFHRTADQRFVIKCISRTELQMFLDCAPAYMEYMSKAFFHGLPTVLCKIVGVYQIGYHNRETGKRSMEQVAVMQNIFYGRRISKTFDLKGSLRGRFARHLHGGSGVQNKDNADQSETNTTFFNNMSSDDEECEEKMLNQHNTLLDGDFLEFTNGRPLPMNDRAKAVFHMSILNDTLFLSIINVLDYSILVGIDEENMELVVGIIDFMRQYDIMKQMERVGKSLPMVVGSEAPTIIQPPLYKVRFTNAMERYFMTVPSKWTTI